VAVPGFERGGGRGLCQRVEGVVLKSLKVLKVEVKAIVLAWFGHSSINMMVKINRERSERGKK